jgi:thiamine pyrophosphate-dependent acetolactate synthase large subunit-like protein
LALKVHDAAVLGLRAEFQTLDPSGVCKGFFVGDPKDLKGTFKVAINLRGPALVNVVISRASARKPRQFRCHS